MKFTADNLILFIFIVYVGGFLEEIATISKTFFLNCGFYPFLEGKSNLEMWTLSPTLNLGCLNSRSSLLYKKDEKSDFFTFFGIKSLEHFLREFSVVTNWVNLWM